MTGYLYRGDPWLEHVNAAIMAARPGQPQMPVHTFTWPVQGTRRNPAVCGTEAGYGAHRGRGEKPCEPCRTARSTARKRRRELAA